MNEEVINKLQEIFTPVAEKIGQGAQFGWEVVLRQQYVVAVLGVIQFIFGIVVMIATYYICKKAYNSFNEDEGEGSIMLGVTVGTIGAGLSFICIPVGIYNAVTHFINPAYYALEFFINLAK